MAKIAVSTSGAPAAIGPYSQAVRAGGLLFLSGQLGIDPTTGELAEGVKAQAERSCQNLRAVLAAAGCTMEDVVKTTIFLADLRDFAPVNEAYAAAFKKDYPARSTIQAMGLPKGGLVEIDAIALAKTE